YWLLRVSHQILADGWSWKVYVQELAEAYRRRCEGAALSLEAHAANLDYRDYAVWQRRVWSPGTEFRGQLAAWWKEVFANQPAKMELPLQGRPLLQRLRGAEPKPSDGRLWSALDPAVRSRLGNLEREAATTHFVIGLAAFAVHVGTVTGRRNL